MTGNQNGFPFASQSSRIKEAYLCNTDGIEAVDWLIQNQKLRIVHNGKGDGKPLLHTKRILRKSFLCFVGQSYQIQSVFDGMIVWYPPQGSKDTQVLCAGQNLDKSRGLNQATDTGQQPFHSPAKGFPQILTSPEVGFVKPNSIFMVVVFPAPFLISIYLIIIFYNRILF